MGIAENFKTFCGNLSIDLTTRSTISYRCKRITKQLNIEFWNLDNDTCFSRYVGSYGRGTAIYDISDVDMIFELPGHLKSQYSNHKYNGQAALLQRVRQAISSTYPLSYIGADGQVVKVEFSDNIYFEVVTSFENSDGSFTHPDSNDGGKWRKTNPKPEIEAISLGDSAWNGNLKRLCRMARIWKEVWNVPMVGLLIDTLAFRFLYDWKYKNELYLYYDWMSRDFFKYLSEQNPDQLYWYAIGSNQHIFRIGNFEYKAKRCYNISLEAIAKQGEGYEWSSRQKWREIYGTAFPD